VITGTTRLAAVIGTPVRHSLSPAILNAAFTAAGEDWAFVALEVPAGQGGAAVAAVRTLGLGGLSVTMPHKAAAHDAVEVRTPEAADLGAVNCVFFRDDRLVGDNTDGPGFLDALREDPGIEVTGLRCAVVGAGGAGRAVIRALGAAGAADVAVLTRRPEPARRAAPLAGAADLVVNATSLGMGLGGPGEPLPVDPAALHPGQVVADLVYHPEVTPLVAAARDQGVRAVNGLGMLVHQAAHAFVRWTGGDPPIGAMNAAARAALATQSDVD
jgi:shikimate dehydrogenase